MADIEISVDAGTSKRLLTAGKYCDKNILVSASGGAASPVIEPLEVTENGTYTAPAGVDGYSPVTVNVTNGQEPEPPDDGKTRLYINVPANVIPDRPPPRNQVPLYIKQTVANGVIIDWGDSTEAETLPGTGAVNTTHNYEKAGNYVISLEPTNGCVLDFGDDSSSNCVLGGTKTQTKYYSSLLRRCILGKNISIGKYAFRSCGFTSIFIPNSIETIQNNAFNSCYSLTSVLVSESVTNIEYGVFAQCTQAKEYHFLSKDPPVLGSTTVFLSIPPDCIIYVPKGRGDVYKTATNWTIIADQIQEEP